MQELCILDRWEGDTAVIEVSDEADLTHWQRANRGELPAEAREGDVLTRSGQGWQVDREATAARREKMARRLARLKNRGNP
ncbi:hypothetical protein B5G38_03070 [Gemmiger sp. An87]|nr:hypothetical protein B5G38_03070 [Gemmiger sp. An87]